MFDTARRRLLVGAATLAAAFAVQADRGPRWTYEVTVTNVTYGQRFTPLLLATHEPTIALFRLGTAASPELRALAEDGNVGPQKAALDASPAVNATMAGTGLLEPGKSVTFRIQANPWRDRLSLAAMLIPTNDGFVALNAVALPGPHSGGALHFARVYDAGTEVNDELCSSIPGPFYPECNNGPGGGARVDGGEGFVHVHRGMHGVGNMTAADRDWRNPVAQVVIKLVR